VGTAITLDLDGLTLAYSKNFRGTELTRLPLYRIDFMQWRAGVDIPHSEYLKTHAEILKQDEWIIDGYGCVPSAWERFAAADTLVYVDLPLFTHYRWVIKRLVKSVIVKPEAGRKVVRCGAAVCEPTG
jgi:adenylate kinase family enzyme